jgi:rod shape-determining protein MreC
MKWFREHMRLSTILVILLLLLSLTVASFLNQGNNSWVGGQINRVTAFIQEPITTTGNGIANNLRAIFQFRSIMEENEALTMENQELRQKVINQSLSQQDLDDLRNLSAAMSYVNPQEYYDSVVGTVIATDGSLWYNIFTINVGTSQGVHKNAVVINGDGLIGIVLDVGPDWSKVISIVDEYNNVSFQAYRDLGLLGILSGDGTGALTGYMLDAEAPIIEGDVLISSGLELYPRGIPIGKVSQVTWDKDALLRTILVEPAVNFSNIQKVAVIITESRKVEEVQ